ncbi:putative virulence factor [Yersinia frederiksenii]|nr:putative virulence factor [Yersinia frederiksenii]
MAKIILRSGYLDDFIALGENGQTIFDAALQIRETLRLRNQHMLLDCLAIPQSNDAEDKVDWYTPREGTITPWACASEQQCEDALVYLENCLVAAYEISQRCLQAEKIAVQLFGSLMIKVLQFPASQHVYLIDNKPVITFWGFVNLNASAREDVFDCLRVCPQVDDEIPPVLEQPSSEQPLAVAEEDIVDPEAVIVTLSQREAPLLPPPVAKIVDELPPSIPPQSKIRSIWQRTLLKITVLIIVLVTIFLASSYLTKETILPESPETVSEAVIPVPTQDIVIPVNKLPLQYATVATPAIIAPVKVAETAQVEPANNALTNHVPAKNALVLPANAVKAGSTKFLTGTWRATIDIKSPVTGRPASLRYQINNKTGTVRTVHGDNVTCKSDIELGLMQSGNLVIKSRGQAKCSDGTRYSFPEVTCTQGLTGAAQCTARYADDTLVPITFIKVSK